MPRDLIYSEGCGCEVMFFGSVGYSSSRMLPGDRCTFHTQRNQGVARDEFMDRARNWLWLAKQNLIEAEDL